MASNREFNLIASVPHTGEQSTSVVQNLNNDSAHFITNITSLSSGQYLTLNIYGITDSGAQYTIFTSLPMNQVTTYRQVMGPAFECVPGIACRDFMPKQFKAVLTPAIPGQTDTYSFDIAMGLG